MSVALARAAMKNFLMSPDPKVLCIKGLWGTGKTYAWNDVLTSSATNPSFSKYAYVSLFGINSLDAVKSSIFENTVSIRHLSAKPTVKTFGENLSFVAEDIEKFGRKSAKFLFRNSYAGKYIGGLEALTFLAVQKTIVCVDDLERCGAGLPLRDVLGLVSYLKAERDCKVVIILNDEKLGGTDQTDFWTYFEKVVDISIDFSPSAEECATIALPTDNKIEQLLKKNSTALGISNIRVIKQIERLVKSVAPKLAGFDGRILEQAIQTLTLLGWCKHGADAPRVEFVRHKRGRSIYGLTKPSQLTEEEKAWDSLLDKYGFTMMDEFDVTLLDGIEKGYFDEDAVSAAAQQLDADIRAKDSEEFFSAAWRLYHDSFENNEEELVEAIKASFAKAVKQITPVNLNGTVRLLKDLERDDVARTLISKYVSYRENEPKLFELERSPFGSEVNDPDVRAAFAEQVKRIIERPNPAALLLKIARNSSWNPEDIEFLSSLGPDDFRQIFRTAGENAPRIIGACQTLGRINEPNLKLIGDNATAALRKIGSESRLNRRRVSRYGIEVPASSPNGLSKS